VTAAGEALRDHAQQLAVIAAQAVGQVDGVRGQLDGQFAALGEAANAAAQRLKQAGEAARAEAQGIGAAGEGAAKLGEQVAAAMRRQLQALAAAVAEADARIETQRGRLRDQAGELAGSADKAVERLRDLGEVYHHQSAALAAAAERAGLKAKEAAGAFTEQTKALVQAAQEAATLAQRAREASLAERHEGFLKAASAILDTLQSLAVDLTRSFEQPVPPAVWQRFHAGERDVFARHLLDLQDRQAPGIIKQKFEGDAQFRGHVLRYLDQFDGLLAEARACDPLDMLGATFLTADVGKLYLVLSTAIGRPRQ
jgi:hypothetical protein